MSRVAQGLTAQRFAGKPLRQPSYSMRSVPHCKSSLAGSTIGEVSNRDHFNDAMAEMVLLCNEVMRRKAMRQATVTNSASVTNYSVSDGDATTKSKTTTRTSKSRKDDKKAASKPLSLEYLADRCDVDDPIWGYIVRTAQHDATHNPSNADTSNRSKNNPSHANHITPNNDRKQTRGRKRKKRIETPSPSPPIPSHNGMMQGFITVTTFTNWQTSFRWDSMHDSAFSYDEPDVAMAMASKQRKYDEDGSLAAQIQNTVRCGDPWNEGIVWPRVAEISLLGGLGCGKVLLSLVIERLEAMQPTAKQNYDYVVLQATNNSIPFYESMGFVRVGAVTKKQQEHTEKQQQKQQQQSVDTGIASSPIMKIKTKERIPLSKLSKSYNVDVWDVIFLNKEIYAKMTPKSVIQKDTELFIPDVSKLDGSSNANNDGSNNSSVTQWYDAKDNETPREIAKKFNVNLKQLLAANKGRIQGLMQHSKLVENTRIQVSNLDVHYDEHVPYCHWTFPDDKFENNEPSYMMARKLNRKSRKEVVNKPIESSLAIPITKYQPPQNVEIIESQKKILEKTTTPQKTPKKSKKRKLHPDQPIPPKRAKSGYFFFLEEEREKMKASETKLTNKEFFQIASAKWKELKDRTAYDTLREQAIIEYRERMERYNKEMEKFKADHPDWVEEVVKTPPPSQSKKSPNLYNKVVKLTEDGRREAGAEFQYYYVLTYIPDLFWCHLAPMRRKGIFGDRWQKVKGRTRWVLVGEGEGKELDISAAVCEVVKSRCMKRCDDADQEEWDINDKEYEQSVNTTATTISINKNSSTPIVETNTTTSAVSVSSVSAKENLLSSGESDNELDTPKSSPKASLIKADTMYSRLLRRHQ